jgi:hypothetical protein
VTRIVADVGFGYTITDSITWTDITQYVDLNKTGITVNSRGAADELSETQPTTCTLRLDNSDGRFTPDRATSPYWPNVKKNVPIRLRVVTVSKNFVTNPTFETDTSDWSSSGTPSLARSTAQFQQGAASMLVTWGAVSSQSVRTTLYGLDIGTTYTASAYVRVPVGDQAVRLKVAAASTGTDYAFGSYSTLNNTFERITCTFTATETSVQLRINPQTPTGAGDQAYVDAVQVEVGAAATAFDATAAQLHPRFFGVVNQWPVTWAGLYSTVSITCTDVFKLLSRTPQLRPMLVQEVLLDGPLAYYPMGEDSDSTSAGDESGAVGAASLSIQQKGSGGSLTFGTGEGADDTLGAPTFTPDDSANGKYLRANLGQAFQDATATQFKLMEAWFSTLTRGRNILTVFSSDEGRYIIWYLAAATGFLTAEIKAPTTSATTVTVGSTDLANGKPHHFVYQELTKAVYVDGVSLGTFPAIFTVATMDTLHVGASQNGFQLWQGTVSHVALYADTSLAAADLATHYTTGTTVHSGETADGRVARLASYVGMTTEAQGSVFTGVEMQKGLGKSALEHMREVERTEAGRLLASRSSAAIVLQSRSLRYNPVSAFSVAYADLETNDVEVADDDQKMINTVLLSRPTGSQTRVVNQAARDTYGPYEDSLELFTTSDTAMIDRGNWVVNRYGDPPPEPRTIPLEASTLALATYRAILDADVSSVFTITDLPDQAAAATATCTIEGYSETITQGQHKISLYTSRTDRDTRWVLDDATYSVLGTTTRLGF